MNATANFFKEVEGMYMGPFPSNSKIGDLGDRKIFKSHGLIFSNLDCSKDFIFSLNVMFHL